MERDENIDSSNVVSEADVNLNVASSKTPGRQSRLTGASSRKGQKTPGASRSSIVTGATPATSSRTRRGSAAAGASALGSMEPKEAVAALVALAAAATKPGTDNWAKHDAFSTSLVEVAVKGSRAGECLAMLAPHTGAMMSALATCISCTRSGTITTSLTCLRAMIDCAALKDGINRSLDEVYAAMIGPLMPTQPQVVRDEVVATMQAAMAKINAAKIVHALCKEITSKKFDNNAKMTAQMLALVADGLDSLAWGAIGAAAKTAAAAGSESSASKSLQALPQPYYSDILKALSRLSIRAAPLLKEPLERAVRAFVFRGEQNSTLTAERRDLARRDIKTVEDFDAFVKTVMGKVSRDTHSMELPAVTTSSNSGHARLRSASIAGGLGSPLPASARKAATKGGYASTLPKDFQSPEPVPAPTAAINAAAPAADPAAALKNQSHPLPDSAFHQEYNTAGAGLLDELVVPSAGAAMAAPGKADGQCYDYSFVDGPEAELSVAAAPAAAPAVVSGEEDPSEAVKRLEGEFEDVDVTVAAPVNASTLLDITAQPMIALDETATVAPNAAADDEDEDIQFKTDAPADTQEVGLLSPVNVAPLAKALDMSVVGAGVDDTMTLDASVAVIPSAELLAQSSPPQIAAPVVVNQGPSYHYRNSSMIPMDATMLAAVAAAPAPAVVANRRSSGQKRKHSEAAEEEVIATVSPIVTATVLQPVSQNVGSGNPASPNTQLGALKDVAHRLKRQRVIVEAASKAGDSAELQAASEAQSAMLGSAVNLVANLAAGRKTAVAADLTAQKAFWAGQKETWQKRRDEDRARRAAAGNTAAHQPVATPIPTIEAMNEQQ